MTVYTESTMIVISIFIFVKMSIWLFSIRASKPQAPKFQTVRRHKKQSKERTFESQPAFNSNQSSTWEPLDSTEEINELVTGWRRKSKEFERVIENNVMESQKEIAAMKNRNQKDRFQRFNSHFDTSDF